MQFGSRREKLDGQSGRHETIGLTEEVRRAQAQYELLRGAEGRVEKDVGGRQLDG